LDAKNLEQDELAEKIAGNCSRASIVITDVGHPFDETLQKALKEKEITRFAYYDNPESFVPGGYSSTAAKVMKLAQGVFFANAHLAKDKIYSELGKEIDLTGKERIGIGYYPVSQAGVVAKKRETEHEAKRAEFLKKLDIEDTGQKVCVYFGGNNEEYFERAFPAFLSFLKAEDLNLENVVIVVHQHPGAKKENLDVQKLDACLKNFSDKPKVIVSDFSSDDAQVLADVALYYQTSMAPQFILSGIPTVQVGHERYEDILVRNHLASTATNSEEFVHHLKDMKEQPKEAIFKGLGYEEKWPENLKKAIQGNMLRK
ncbi:MAG: hypothetical protein AABZ92_00465, partial [Verrucomicrobiota bacterium]